MWRILIINFRRRDPRLVFRPPFDSSPVSKLLSQSRVARLLDKPGTTGFGATQLEVDAEFSANAEIAASLRKLNTDMSVNCEWR
jgi:hypothetical protein